MVSRPSAVVDDGAVGCLTPMMQAYYSLLEEYDGGKDSLSIEKNSDNHQDDVAA